MMNWIQKHLRGERRQAAFKQGWWATLIQVVEAGRGLLIVPLAVHYIGLRGYGLWLTIYGILQALTLLDLGLTGPFQRDMAIEYAKRGKADLGKILSLGIIIAGVMSSVILSIGLIVIFGAQLYFASQIAELPFATIAFLMAAFASSLSIINTFLRASGSARLKPTSVMMPMLGFKLLSIVITFGLFLMGMGVLAISGGILFAEVGILVTYLWMTVRDGLITLQIPSFAQLRPWLVIAKSTFLSRMLGGASERLETTIIGMMISLEMASIFAISKKLATFIDQILHTGWSSVMSPLINFAEHHDKNETAKKFSWIFGVIFRASLSMYVGYLFVNVWFIKYWVGKQALADEYLYLLIALSMVSIVIFDVLNETIMLLNQPITAAKQFMVVAVLRLMCMATLGWHWGVNGMVGGVFCANLFGIALAWKRVKNQLQGLTYNSDLSTTGWSLFALILLVLAGYQFGVLGTVLEIGPTVFFLAILALLYVTMEWLNQRLKVR